MHPVALGFLTALGAGIGLGVGRVSVYLEKVERLAEEEAEERHEYEAEMAHQREAALAEGKPEPKAEAWIPEKYGWTWLEWLLAPLLTAAAFYLFTVHETTAAGLAIHLLWCVIFVQIVIFDFKHRLILNRITYPAIGLAVVLAPVSPQVGLLPALVGAAVLGVFFLILNLLFRGGIGMGDVKLAALIGAIAGLNTAGTKTYAAVNAIAAGIILAGIVTVILLVTRRKHLSDTIAYGQFLCIGAALALYNLS